ncbi:transposase [Horticoccus sp. 23ND18S-11]|uniref:transposase n=1 Tax=Horticoccus sp. 23ND18S-11 TaxID=3391832 RepID=UPI0039C8C649
MSSRFAEHSDKRHGARDVGGASSSLFESREQDAPATPPVRGTVWEFFNPLSEIEIRTGGNLPHWEQASVWYFVTFRLADALPRDVVEKIRLQRKQWRRTHDLHRLSRDDLAEYHQLFSARYEQLLHAGSGSCVLRDPVYADLVRGALRHFDGQRYVLDEHVVMPNHVHVLVKTLAGYGLANTLHSWKSYTANQLNRRLGRTGPLWQHESYDHIVRSASALETIRRYIRENPKVAGASSSRS